jgi:hypothetical protein
MTLEDKEKIREVSKEMLKVLSNYKPEELHKHLHSRIWDLENILKTIISKGS